MKKTILSFFLIIAIFAFIPTKLIASDWYMQIRSSYFYPTSKPVREAYSRVWLDYQFEASTLISGNWHFWTNVNWSSKRGNRDFNSFDERTRIWVLPISAGAKYQFPLNSCLSLYLGAGLSYTALRVEHEFSFFHEKHFTTRQSLGLVGKSGLMWLLSDYTFLDFFIDYYHQRFNISAHCCKNEDLKSHYRVDLSGFKFGLGLGVYF